MELKQRVAAFVQLGKTLQVFAENNGWKGYETGISAQEYEEMNALIAKQVFHNGWFTEENVRHALSAIATSLEEEKINIWLSAYPELTNTSKKITVGLVMAGNIPLVGFHDILCILISGHKVIAKTSSQDGELLPRIVELLTKFNPEFKLLIEFTNGKMEGFDAVVATGSNNTSRYFEHYFGKYPNIIRKNRTSVALITGQETEEELKALGKDIFQYFGLGCRNVSKLFVPREYDLNQLFGVVYDYQDIINHKKYANNYDYNKTLYLMDRKTIVENGFLLMKEDKALTSPVATLFYEYYENETEIEQRLEEEKENIQCIVSKQHVPFGKAQLPELWDYADGVDVMQFLLEQ